MLLQTVLVKNKNISLKLVRFSFLWPGLQAFHQNYYYCGWLWNLHSMKLIFMVVFISTKAFKVYSDNNLYSFLYLSY